MARPVAQAAFAHRRHPGVYLLVILVAAACVALVVVRAQVHAAEQGTTALRTSILNASAQCAAVEGAYPSSLDHLVEAYGIRFDPEAYDVRYEVFADNVAPTVQVMRR